MVRIFSFRRDDINSATKNAKFSAIRRARSEKFGFSIDKDELKVVVTGFLRYDPIMAAPLKRPQGLRSWFAFLIATALGAGLSPFAPGTAGSLVALPLPIITQDWPFSSRFGAWLALTIAGIWAAKVWDETQQSSDNQSIVIDEVVGLWLTAWTVRTTEGLLVAFVLFRIFDVWKIPPVRQVDRWSKKKSSPWLGGFGVVADDLLAGLQGLAVILALQKWGILS